MAQQFAMEFTPEVNQDYLASLLNPIDEEERKAVGQARDEGAAAGLVGQAAMGSRLGYAHEVAGRARSSTIAGFNESVAGMRRGERLTAEKESYESNEAAKDRTFREHMAQIGYQYADASRAAENRHQDILGQQGMVTGLIGGAASAATGGYFGGLGRAAGMAKTAKSSYDYAGSDGGYLDVADRA